MSVLLNIVYGYGLGVALVFVGAVIAATLNHLDHERRARRGAARIALRAHVWPLLIVQLVIHMAKGLVAWSKW